MRCDIKQDYIFRPTLMKMKAYLMEDLTKTKQI